MEPFKILETIQQEFKANGYAQVIRYNPFEYIGETPKAFVISRGTGIDTRIPFSQVLIGIEAVQNDINVYDGGPGKLKDYGIAHNNLPIWTLLHLAPKSDY